MNGTVCSGVGEGKFFMSLEPYVEQMKEKLGYTPYAGTLNVCVDKSAAKQFIETKESIIINGFTKGVKEFGEVHCYPCTLNNTPCHIIIPQYTRYELDTLELIAPDYLRETLSLHDNDEVTIE